ncbi:hypothetical protein KI387_025521, partial [Taxus chinensis]
MLEASGALQRFSIREYISSSNNNICEASDGRVVRSHGGSFSKVNAGYKRVYSDKILISSERIGRIGVQGIKSEFLQFSSGGLCRTNGISGNPLLSKYLPGNHKRTMLGNIACLSTSVRDNLATGSQQPEGSESGKLVKKGASGTSEQPGADIHILKTLAKYLWLKDNPEFRIRILVALGLLIGAKVLNVQVPFLFKLAVDGLSAAIGASNTTVAATVSNSTLLALFGTPVAVLVGYGIARGGASACN